MTRVKIRDRMLLHLPGRDLEGEIYYDRSWFSLVVVDAITGVREQLALNPCPPGPRLRSGQVYVRDWGNHHGLAAALYETGVADRVLTVIVGADQRTGYRMRVNTHDPGPGNPPYEFADNRDPTFDEQVRSAELWRKCTALC